MIMLVRAKTTYTPNCTFIVECTYSAKCSFGVSVRSTFSKRHAFKVKCKIKGGVRVTQNIVKKGPTLITFDIKH